MEMYDTDYITTMVENVKDHPSNVNSVAITDKVLSDKPAPVKPKPIISDLAEITSKIILDDDLVKPEPIWDHRQLKMVDDFYERLYSAEGSVIRGSIYKGIKSADGTEFNNKRFSHNALRQYLLPQTTEVNTYITTSTFLKGGRKLATLYSLGAFVVDLDTVKAGLIIPAPMDYVKNTIAPLCQAHNLQYSAVVWTGHGYQIYWFFDRIFIQNESFKRGVLAKYGLVLDELRRLFDPDLVDWSVNSAVAYTRAPRSLNVKPEYDSSATVEVLDLKPTSYSLANLADRALGEYHKQIELIPEDTSKSKLANQKKHHRPWNTIAMAYDVAKLIKMRHGQLTGYRHLLLYYVYSLGENIRYANAMLSEPVEENWIRATINGSARKKHYTADKFIQTFKVTPDEWSNLLVMKPSKIKDLAKTIDKYEHKYTKLVKSTLMALRSVYAKNAKSRGNKKDNIAKKLNVSSSTVGRLLKMQVNTTDMLEQATALIEMVTMVVNLGGTVDKSKVEALNEAVKKLNNAVGQRELLNQISILEKVA